MLPSPAPDSSNSTLGPHLAPDEMILIMGGPGSGKGTTGRELARILDAEVRSTGQLMRQSHDPDLLSVMDRGDLVPEADLERLLDTAIPALAGRPLILDGATKKPREAEWLLARLERFGRRLPVVCYLEVDEALARERILTADRGREDDAPEYQEHRWHEFRTSTMMSLEVYRQAGLLETIQGDAPIDGIVREMLGALARRQAARDAS